MFCTARDSFLYAVGYNVVTASVVVAVGVVLWHLSANVRPGRGRRK
jgi:hypothetical protein